MKAPFLTVAGVVLLTLCILESARSTGSVSGTDVRSVAFTGGKWFDGRGFQDVTFYSVGGVLRTSKPTRVEETIDLAGGYVVPAYGDAHNHNISRPPRRKELVRYIKDGVFYVMIQNNIVSHHADADTTGDIDIVYANGGITPSGGHVVSLHEKLIDWGVIKDMTKPELDGRAFFVVDKVEGLDEKWNALLESDPGFIKIFLGFSAQHGSRLGDSYPGLRGLDPSIVPIVVKRAHDAGLRVSAHIETAADFRLAVDSGVDIVAHLPGWRVGIDAGFESYVRERWLLSDNDAAAARERGTVVLTTTLAGNISTKPDHPHFDDVLAIHRDNLQTLIKNRVTIAIGSDFYNGTSVHEAFMLGTQPIVDGIPPIGAFDNETIVMMLCELTPRLIFPNRKVGLLRDGFEANFLVLAGDPISDLKNLSRIERRFKQGIEVMVP